MRRRPWQPGYGEQVDDPVIVGPDGESGQWARDVAARVGAPVAVVQKVRLGDTDVRSTRAADRMLTCEHTPVLLDDIISSGHTLVDGDRAPARHGQHAPVCVAVHGLMAGDARRSSKQAGAARVVCTNTLRRRVQRSSTSARCIAEGVRAMLAESPAEDAT